MSFKNPAVNRPKWRDKKEGEVIEVGDQYQQLDGRWFPSGMFGQIVGTTKFPTGDVIRYRTKRPPPSSSF
jgi:hypothetical protein